MLNKIHKEIVQEVIDNGICKANIKDILPESDINKFNNIIGFYNEFMSDSNVVDRINRIYSGNPIQDRHKWYEINHSHFLKRGLQLGDHSIIEFFISETFIKMAELFYGIEPRVRNILTWIHPQNPYQKEFSSQAWHRDPEGYKIFKVFAFFNDIDENNGALQYAKKTQYGGEHQHITYNIDGSGHKSKPPGWPLSYPIPENNKMYATGEAGTVYFVNTHGLHKGGLVREGIRCMGQANYLHPNCYAISGDKSLGKFNHTPNFNYVDYNSEQYLNLTDLQKEVLK